MSSLLAWPWCKFVRQEIALESGAISMRDPFADLTKRMIVLLTPQNINIFVLFNVIIYLPSITSYY
jgi:hypothetical protein